MRGKAGADRISELVTELVAAGQPYCENSLDGPARPPEELGIALPVAALLEDWGFDVTLVGRYRTRPNVVASRRFGPGPTLLLNDHLDTYPSGPPSRWKMCSDPYEAVEHEGRIYARGTSDTRANLAALLLAVEQVVIDPPTRGTLVVALTVDEERNGVEGSLYLLEQGLIDCDASITVEPTAWTDGDSGGIALAVAQTGHALLDATCTGQSAHIWRPDTGSNPAQALLAMVSDLSQRPVNDWPISVVGLSAGEAGMAQFTPLEARVRFAAVNIGPDVAAGQVLVAFQRRLDELRPQGVSVAVTFVPGPTFVAGTHALESAEPIVDIVGRAYRDITGTPVRHYTKPAFNDTIRFRHAGIAAVTFGPGDDGWAVYDESISVARIELAIAVLENTIRGFLVEGTGTVQEVDSGHSRSGDLANTIG